MQFESYLSSVFSESTRKYFFLVLHARIELPNILIRCRCLSIKLPCFILVTDSVAVAVSHQYRTHLLHLNSHPSKVSELNSSHELSNEEVCVND